MGHRGSPVAPSHALIVRAMAGISGAARIAAVGVVVAGCGWFAPPSEAVGDCELNILSEVRGSGRPMQPPYAIELTPPVDEARFGPSGIIFDGNGWRFVEVTVTDPTGLARQEHIEARDFYGERWVINMPGLWRIRLSDAVAGCVREFSIDARPS